MRREAALGLEGGGTPAEVRQFVGHLEHVRELVGRPVAFVLIAHTNKGGQVSGAWDGATDTLAHLMAMGNGSTRLHWQKCRWAGSLHGATWNLHWRDGETFELDEKPAVTIDTIEADLLAAVTENPGASWSKTRERITGNDKDKARVRDRLIADGAIVNTATRDNYFTLYPADDPEATRASLSTGLARLTDAPQNGASDPSRATAPALRGTGHEHGHDAQGSHPDENEIERLAAIADAMGLR